MMAEKWLQPVPGWSKAALMMVSLMGFSPLTVQGGDPFLGKEVYKRHCARCHGAAGHGELVGTPDFSWKGAGRNGLSRPDPQLVSRIKVGRGVCPSFHGILTDMDIMNVVTYLRTIR